MDSDIDNISEDEMKSCPGFVDYKSVIEGLPHPGPAKESISLAFAKPPPILSALRTDPLNSGLSDLQYETCCRIMDAHSEYLPDGCRRGFFLGDGTGMGKGRQIAAVIKQNYLEGRKKAIWVTTTPSLLESAARDLEDVGVKTVHLRINIGRTRIKPSKNVLAFPIFKLKDCKPSELTIKTGVLLISYSMLSCGVNSQQYKDLLAFMGEEFDGVIAFDESHRAKSYNPSHVKKSTATGNAVVELQDYARNARIIYASATGATELNHMAYMTRLGLWGSEALFQDATTFLEEMKKRGVGALELLAVELKTRGIYISRQIGYENVNCDFDIVQLDNTWCVIYELSVDLFKELMKLESIFPKKDTPINESSFWAAQQRYFLSVCTASKVDRAIDLTEAYVAQGYSVVIGLQHTGEASYKSVRNHPEHQNSLLLFNLMDCLSAFGFSKGETDCVEPKSKKRRLLPSSNSPVQKLTQDDNTLEYNLESCLDKLRGRELVQKIGMMYIKLKQMLELIQNPLDDLIEKLGGVNKVAELTGRATRPIGGKEISRRDSKKRLAVPVNNAEVECFQTGRKLIAIISDAASTGFSLHSQAVGRNQKARPRIHITIELPWSADRVVQQLGRTHRSNQICPPKYVFVFTNIPAECRFVSTISSRLDRLGAITNGDRKLSSFNIPCAFGKDEHFSRIALENMFNWCSGKYESEVFCDKPSKIKMLMDINILCLSNNERLVPRNGLKNVEKFLNRVFCLTMTDQKTLLDMLEEEVNIAIENAKMNSQYDDGIKDFRIPVGSRQSIKSTESFAVKGRCVLLNEVELDRGMSFPYAIKMRAKIIEIHGKRESFFMIGDKTVIMCISMKTVNERVTYYNVYSPTKGKLGMHKLIELTNQGFSKSTDQQKIKQLWDHIYVSTNYECRHKLGTGRCSKLNCQAGSRLKRFFILSGAIMEVWNGIAHRVAPYIMSVIRISIEDNKEIIGVNIPQHAVPAVRVYLNLL